MPCMLKKNGVLFLILLIIAAVIFVFNQSVSAERAGQSDPQEALIKKVITESAAHFGWNQNYCWTHQPPGQETVPSGDGWVLQDRQPITVCPTLWGPSEMFEQQGDQYVPMAGAGYGIDAYAPVPADTLYLEETVFRIFAYPTVEAAQADMNETLNNLLPQYSTRIDMHGYPAVKTLDIIDFQANRFMFSAAEFYNSKIGQTISPEELAEVFYQNAIKYELITPSGTEQDNDDDTDEDIESQLEMKVSAEPQSFSKPGDQGTIMVTLTDSDGTPAAGVTVTLYDADTNFNIAEGTTGTSGKTTFMVDHHDETRKSYTYRLQTPLISKTITIPVFAMGIQLELNSLTGTAYKGVVADGESTMEIIIKLDGVDPDGELNISTKPPLGELEGKAIRSGNVIKLDNGEASIFYKPPDYLKTDQLIRQDENTLIWVAVVPITFTYIAADGRTEDFATEIEIYRPPVLLVHGFTGDRTTWSSLAEYLNARKYDTYSGQYYAGNHSIWEQSCLLRDHIGEKKETYLQNNIKITKVDLVAHSMGGLISRFYLNTRFMPWFDPTIPWDSFYRGDVRKLIMVGTPNHGCSKFDLWSGRFISWLGQQHEAAAEQLYSEGAFLTHLNRYEHLGLHLNRKVEHGNIYSWSAAPGFFNGDGIVSAASAHLNGVNQYMIRDHIHSPAVVTQYLSINFNAPSITTSPTVFAKVEEWLNNKIYRPALQNMTILVTKTEGEVYLQEIDQMKDGVIPKRYIKTTVLSAGVPMDPYDYLSTEPDSRATISFFVNNQRWGSIYLDQNTEIKLGYVSPRLTEVLLSYGSARFATQKIDKSGHFSVNLEAQDGRWQNIACLDSDFVVFKDSQSSVYSLDGDLVFSMETATGELIGEELTNGESVIATESEGLVRASTPQQTWWENSFYNASSWETIKIYLHITIKKASSLWAVNVVYADSSSLLDQFSDYKIVQGLQKLLSALRSSEVEDLTGGDNKGITWVFIAAVLVLALMFALLIPLLKRKWFTTFAILIIIPLLISSFLLYKLGWERISLLFSEEDRAAEILDQEQEPVVIPEESLEPPIEVVPEPETGTGETALNLEALVYNCRVLDLFGMSLDEIKAIIGNPDEEGWFAGEYYLWNDAGALIGGNENGLSQQQELFIAGSEITMIRMDQFLSIREGSSFDDVRQLLGANLNVEDWSDNEWFEFVMVYRFREYEFIFNSPNPAGPVSFIMAKRN
jgi:pimeloyl-ACP methyl ester carboxylesterase